MKVIFGVCRGYALLLSIGSYWVYPHNMQLGGWMKYDVFQGYDICFVVTSGGMVIKGSTTMICSCV